jgi:hypothetical protein
MKYPSHAVTAVTLLCATITTSILSDFTATVETGMNMTGTFETPCVELKVTSSKSHLLTVQVMLKVTWPVFWSRQVHKANGECFEYLLQYNRLHSLQYAEAVAVSRSDYGKEFLEPLSSRSVFASLSYTFQMTLSNSS